MSLRISTMMERCRCHEAAKGKVRARLGDRCVIVEDLVLDRWRRRKAAKGDESFDGCRLRPNTWQVLRLAVAEGLSLGRPLAVDVLAEHVALVQAKNPTL